MRTADNRRFLWTWGLLAASLTLFWACGDGKDDANPAKTATADTVADASAAAGDATATTADVASADAAATDSYAWAPKKYKATIRWTSHGIPHIQAASLGDVAFGQGYAFAKQNLCTLADQIVKVRSERARFFGPGPSEAHITSDFAYHALDVMGHAHRTLQAGLPADVMAVLEGYAAGVNHRMQEAGPAGWPSACVNADWVRPLTPVELMAYYHDLALLASGRNLKNYLANARPPDKTGAQLSPQWLQRQGWPQWSEAALALQEATSEFAALRDHLIGSNGWAIGSERSEQGQGLVVGNPHFPWFGELRLWESHLTVPGALNVQGATLSGVPMVLIGHNDHAAWTATVSASSKFTVYRLQLDPTDPTTYLIDGKPYKMSSRQASVAIKQADGSLKTETRTFWRTHFGPVAVIGAIAEWTTETAWAMRDANEANAAILEHFLRIDQAKSVADIAQVCATVQGNPWTNTMAADDSGAVFYSESHSTPNLSAQAFADWKAAIEGGDMIVKLAWDNSLILLDGSKSSAMWIEEPGARKPGLVPFAKTPHQLRKDYVFNANDSHWLSNLAAPLQGYPFPYGAEQTARSQRTRLNLKMLVEQGEGGASGADGKFSAAELRAMVHNGRIHTAELYRDELLERCKPGTVVQAAIDGAAATAVDLSEACSVLTAWDGTYLPDSKGAVLWREFWYAPDGPAPFFYVAFDAKDPLGTPKGLQPPPPKGDDPYLVLLAKAVLTLKQAGRPLDATIASLQYTLKADQRIAIPGGYHAEGAFQVIGPSLASNDTLLPKMPIPPYVTKKGSPLTTEGYPVGYGSSFVMVVELTPQGPKGQAVLSYSQSTDPASPFFADQTQLFSQRQFRPMRWTDAEIAADPALQVESVGN